jgi:hypothetical protein
MDDEAFGTIADYLRAFEAVRAEGINDKHLAMLRAHFAAPEHTITWARLAETVGYSSGKSVNLQYGKFAGRIARQLGLAEKPADPSGTAWWLWVLVRWARERDPNGHTAFVLRQPAVEAIESLGLTQRPAAELLPDEVECRSRRSADRPPRPLEE